MPRICSRLEASHRFSFLCKQAWRFEGGLCFHRPTEHCIPNREVLLFRRRIRVLVQNNKYKTPRKQIWCGPNLPADFKEEGGRRGRGPLKRGPQLALVSHTHPHQLTLCPLSSSHRPSGWGSGGLHLPAVSTGRQGAPAGLRGWTLHLCPAGSKDTSSCLLQPVWDSTSPRRVHTAGAWTQLCVPWSYV